MERVPPRRRASPLDAGTMPVRIFTSAVLPAPLAPISPTVSPAPDLQVDVREGRDVDLLPRATKLRLIPRAPGARSNVREDLAHAPGREHVVLPRPGSSAQAHPRPVRVAVRGLEDPERHQLDPAAARLRERVERLLEAGREPAAEVLDGRREVHPAVLVAGALEEGEERLGSPPSTMQAWSRRSSTKPFIARMASPKSSTIPSSVVVSGARVATAT